MIIQIDTDNQQVLVMGETSLNQLLNHITGETLNYAIIVSPEFCDVDDKLMDWCSTLSSDVITQN